MTEEKEKKKTGEISRREFLKDAGLVVGGAAIGSAVLLAACKGGAGVTETVTKTATVTGAPGGTVTVTGAPGGTATVTKTATVTGAPGGTATVTTTVTGPGVAAANVIKLTVNRLPYEVQVEPNWTMQDLLHDHLGFTGIKDMCMGYGACGSCTAIVDGRPVLSCMMLAIECDGKIIETAEGIADSHPVADAFVMEQALQCGYCTPGFVVTAKALLDRNPKPTEDDIRDALGGNICVCVCYPFVIKAVQTAAKVLGGG